MDVSLEIFFFCDDFCLLEKRITAPYLYDSALMKRECTEAASSEAPSAADKTEADL